MSYTALYRKFRPKNFNEIVGQEHITRTLKNQIIANRVGHAYLLTGGRGTGKTSAAKILARAINCLNPKDGEPCNECEICKAAIQGSLTDIVEMDAASNNSVEDIRAIREEVNFLPTVAKYRVYIIDEVHMLSVGAFNALLKTLEEPPKHVKFILATTEPQKLPATILSRCQRFDYKKIPAENIKERLQFICNESNIKITDEALKSISILAEGAMRDGLSILERCVQEGEDLIDDDKVKDLVGIPKIEYINKIVKNIIENNIEESLKSVNIALNDGKDINNLIWEIIKYLKDILLNKSGNILSLYNEKELEQINELSKLISKDRLINCIYCLSELASDIKLTSQKTIMLEVTIMKLCSYSDEKNNIKSENINTVNQNVQPQIDNKILSRISNLEDKINKMSNLVIHNTEKNVDNSVEKVVNTRKSNKTTNASRVSSNIIQSSIPEGKKVENWKTIVNKLKEDGKIILYTNLINTIAVEINDMTVGIVFENGITPFGKSVLDKSENIQELTRVLSMEFGKSMNVKYIDVKKITQENDSLEKISSELGFPINIIDE